MFKYSFFEFIAGIANLVLLTSSKSIFAFIKQSSLLASVEILKDKHFKKYKDLN